MYLVVEDNDGGNKTVMVAIDESAVPGEGRKEEEEEKKTPPSLHHQIVLSSHSSARVFFLTGTCLQDGISYKNGSSVPILDECHAFCECANSQINCDPVVCHPAPRYAHA